MKQLLITTIAAVLLVGCGESAPDISILVAAERGDIKIVKQHLDSGANVNSRDADGWTPLHWSDNIKVVELLILYGADVNAKDRVGVTPLHGAATSGRLEIAELLIAKNVNVNAKALSPDKGYKTPLDVAIHFGYAEVSALLRKHGGKTAEELKAEGK